MRRVRPLLPAAATALLFAAAPAPTRNPLRATPAVGFDERRGATAVGDAVVARAGDWAAYRAFDFDSGVAAFRATVAATAAATLAVHLDRPDGPLLGTAKVAATGLAFADVTCPVDHGQAGIRDVYLVAAAADPGATVTVRSFVFLRAAAAKRPPTDASGRVDKVDDEPQATAAWGMPQAGFADDFAAGMAHWIARGFTVAGGTATAAGDAVAFTPRVYVNKTDTGGEWRTMAQAALSVDVTADVTTARPGVGFTSVDGSQSVYVVLNPAAGRLEAYRHLADGSATLVRAHPRGPTPPPRSTSRPAAPTASASPGRRTRMR